MDQNYFRHVEKEFYIDNANLRLGFSVKVEKPPVWVRLRFSARRCVAVYVYVSVCKILFLLLNIHQNSDFYFHSRIFVLAQTVLWALKESKAKLISVEFGKQNFKSDEIMLHIISVILPIVLAYRRNMH